MDDREGAAGETEQPDKLSPLLALLARGLVNEPESVQVEAVNSGRTLVLELAVAESDVGKIIGRQGKVIRAIRTVVKAAATRQGTRVDVDVV